MAEILLFKKLLKQRKKLVHQKAELYRLTFDKEKLKTDADEIKRYDVAKFQLEKFDTGFKKIEEELDKLAKKLPITQSRNWHKYDVISESTYSSQGFGSYKYAEERANKIVDDIVCYNVPAKIEVKTRKFSGGGGRAPFFSARSSSTFTVYVKADSINREILKRKPGVSFKEWVRLCWKRGINPRVYVPLLPYGIEEQLGVDFFGNNIKDTK